MSEEVMKISYTPDGDTVRCFRTITENNVTRTEEVRIRLAYIDAPEIGNAECHAYAISARAYLRRLLYVGESVKVQILGQDIYGRLLAEIIRLRDYGNCGLRLIHGGYAALWQCPQSRGSRPLFGDRYHGLGECPGRSCDPWAGDWRVPAPGAGRGRG